MTPGVSTHNIGFLMVNVGKYTIPLDPKTMKHEGFNHQYMGSNR